MNNRELNYDIIPQAGENVINQVIERSGEVRSDFTGFDASDGDGYFEESEFEFDEDGTQPWNTGAIPRLFMIRAKSPNSSYNVYTAGTIFTKGAIETVQITDTDGIWYFYFDTNGVLTASQTPWIIKDNGIPISFIYWDETNTKCIYIAEERHSTRMSSTDHSYLHHTRGSAWDALDGGLLLGNYTTAGNGNNAVDAQVSVSGGTIDDEDISINIVNDATPTEKWEQILSPIAEIPIFYLKYEAGLTANTWRVKDAAIYPVYNNVGTGRLGYNFLNGANWEVAEVDNSDFVAVWIVATNDINNPIIGILGQRQDGNIGNARANNILGNLDLSGMPFVEIKFIWRLIFQTRDTYGNTVKARLRDVVDLRGTVEMPTQGFVATSHAQLSNLTYDESGHDDFQQSIYQSAGVPGVDNDDVDTAGIGREFAIGDSWRDTLTDDLYVCADNTSTAAVWQQTNGGGGASPYTEIADGVNVNLTMAGVAGSFRIAGNATASITANTTMTAQQIWVGVNRETSKLHINASTVAMFAGTEFRNMTIQVTGGALGALSVVMNLREKCKLIDIDFEFIGADPTNMVYLTGTSTASTNECELRNIRIRFYSNIGDKMGFLYNTTASAIYSWKIENIIVDTASGHVTYVGANCYFMYLSRCEYFSVSGIKTLSIYQIYRGASTAFDGAIYLTGGSLTSQQTEDTNWSDFMGIDLAFYRVRHINISEITGTRKVCLNTYAGTNPSAVNVTGLVTDNLVFGSAIYKCNISDFTIKTMLTLVNAGQPKILFTNGTVVGNVSLNTADIYWNNVVFISTPTTTSAMHRNRFVNCFFLNSLTLSSGGDSNRFMGCRFGALIVVSDKNKFTNCEFALALTLNGTYNNVSGGCTLLSTVNVGGNYNTVSGCTVTGDILISSSTNKITNNTCAGNISVGVSSTTITDNIVTGNILTHVTNGYILVDGAGAGASLKNIINGNRCFGTFGGNSITFTAATGSCMCIGNVTDNGLLDGGVANTLANNI